MELLNRVKNKIFNTLGGVAQAAGNFLKNDFNRNPVVQSVNNIRQALPQVQQQVQRAVPQIEDTIQDVLPKVQTAASDFWQDQMQRPIAPNLDNLFPGQTPTTRDVLDLPRTIAVQFPSRALGESSMTALGLNAPIGAEDTENPALSKFLFGDKPLKNWNDPTRDSAEVARSIGVPGAAVPLAAIGAGLDLVPDPSDAAKIIAKQGGKKLLKKGAQETGEKVVKAGLGDIGNIPPQAKPSAEALAKIPGVKKMEYTTSPDFVKKDTFMGGEGIVLTFDDGNRAFIQMANNPSRSVVHNQGLALNQIYVEKQGKGVGKKIIESIKKYVDDKTIAGDPTEFVVTRPTEKTQAYWDKFPFLKKEMDGLEYRYSPSKKELLNNNVGETGFAPVRDKQLTIDTPNAPRGAKGPIALTSKRLPIPPSPDDIIPQGNKGYVAEQPIADTGEQVVKNVARNAPEFTEEVIKVGSKPGQPPVRKTADALFSRLIGERDVAGTTGVEIGSKFAHIPVEEGPDVIRALENPKAKVSASAKKYAGEVRMEFDRLYKEAKAAGIDVNYLKNYVTHIWDRPMEEVAQMYKQASSNFKFGKGRTLPTYEEGLEMGLKPKYTNPSQILAEYARKLEETKADIKYLTDMKAQGHQVPAAIGAGRWAPPAETGNIGRAAELGAKASGVVQDITMSGGVPKTPLNAWTFAQTTKEILSGRVMSPLKALVRSSVGNSNEFFRVNTPQIKKMQLRNIPVETTLSVKNLPDKGELKNMFGETAGEAWNKVMNESTFKKFMPQLQIQMFNDVENGLLKAGKSAEEAADIAAQTVKNFYGITGSDVLAKRSKLAQDALSSVFFAPRYRESMINFWTNIVKGMANPFAPENKYNLRFAIGATMTLAAMNHLNEQTMGHGMWDNPESHRDKLLIPLGDGNVIGIPFLASIATLPRLAVKEAGHLASGDLPAAGRELKSLLASSIRPPLDVLTNENYFGQEIYDPAEGGAEQTKDIATFLAGQYNHPYVRGAMEAGLVPGVEKKDQPGYATVAKMLELPIRFTTEKKLSAGYYFDSEASNYKKLSSEHQGVYDTVFKQDESELDATGILRKNMSDAQLLLANPDVLRARNKIQIETARKTGQPVDPFNLLPENHQMLELQRKALPPGDETKSALTTANIEWMKPYWTARAAYFDEMEKKGIITPKESDAEMAVKTTPEMQKTLDEYYKLPYGTGERTAFLQAHPEIVTYWDEKREFTNTQRASLGLPLLEDKGFGGGSGGGGRAGGGSDAKTRSKIRSLNELFATKRKGEKTIKPKAVKTPDLKIPKIAKASVKRRTKTSKQWFTA